MLALSKRFFDINGHFETVMGAVCCDLCVWDNDTIKTINELLTDKRVVALTGDGGTGKTTLMCQLAVYNKNSEAGTIYVNFEKYFCKS